MRATAVSTTGKVTTITYSGGVQSVPLKAAKYTLEAWGAQGGSKNNDVGGLGGYSTGVLETTSAADTTVYVAVGGTGSSTTATSGNPSAGGYNGGGAGYYGTNQGGHGGGGATHFATKTGTLSSFASDASGVYLVAGGGGGGLKSSATETLFGTGGAGGGSSGGRGDDTRYSTQFVGYGGSQTAGGAAGEGGTSGKGSFGQGGSYSTWSSGGGGGWWGGGRSNRSHAGAGGGSGFVSTAAGIASAKYGTGTTGDKTIATALLLSGATYDGNSIPSASAKPSAAGANGYARVTLNNYIAVYHDASGTVVGTSDINASTGAATLTKGSALGVGTKPGGTAPIVGWATSAANASAGTIATDANGKQLTDGASISMGASHSASLQLYPVYTYTVTYMKADCKTAGSTASVTPGSSTTAPKAAADTPSGGYALYGWAESSSTATRKYEPNKSFTPASSVTLYPIYTRTISYNANGGTNPTASTQYYYGGSARAVTLAAGPSGRCLPGRGPGAFPQLAGPARAGRRGARRRSGRKARPGGPGSVPAGAQLGCSYARATPSGMWAAVVKWREPGGPWRQSSRTCGPERADAEAGLAAWRAELAGAGSCGPAPTVAELALAELASELASGRIERSTHDAQAGYARAHLSGTPLGDSPAGALTAAAALRWAESLAASLSPASARIAWGALRKAARRAAREGLLGGDPLAGLPAPRARRREPGSLDAPARAALAGAVAREWGAGSGRALAAALGLYAGLRAGECCALRWRDAAGGEVRVRAAAGRSQSGPYLKAPKSAASARSVPATAALAAALAERASALGGAPDPAGFCCSEDGALPDPKALSRDFSRLCAREGVRDSLGRPATFHSLRHTFATAAVAAGVDVKTLSAMLGHASAKLTLDVYAAADADARAAAAARMEGMYG